jgi:hypothetical protein
MPPNAFMCIPFLAVRQRLGKHVPAATSTHKNTRIFGRIIFYAVHALSKESLLVCLCIPILLLSNNSVKTFRQQRRIVGSVFFNGVRVVSNESDLSVLLITSYFSAIIFSGILKLVFSLFDNFVGTHQMFVGMCTGSWRLKKTLLMHK